MEHLYSSGVIGLVMCRATGVVDCSWWAVLSPIWLPIIILVVAFGWIVGVLFSYLAFRFAVHFLYHSFCGPTHESKKPINHFQDEPDYDYDYDKQRSIVVSERAARRVSVEPDRMRRLFAEDDYASFN